MKMSELSAASGVPVATIKFYLREGLLPAGHRSARNQALYDGSHLRRLRLIRALVEVGALRLSEVRVLLDAIDDETRPLHDVLGVVHRALAMRAIEADEESADALMEVDSFIEGLGWQVKPGAPATRELARALDTLRELGWEVSADVFSPYAEAADHLAAWELERTPQHVSRPQIVEGVVIGTVVFETALLALRRLAEEHHSAHTFASDP
jgi:DNA-binding transcriptional MerR regulator